MRPTTEVELTVKQVADLSTSKHLTREIAGQKDRTVKRDRLWARLVRSGVPQAMIARECGVTPGAVSKALASRA